MNDTVHFLTQYNYWLLVGAVLGRQACLPIPANLVLVAAGALARSGRLSLVMIGGLCVASFLFADFIWYEAGRRTGDRILHLASRISTNSGSWVQKATSVFARYGARTLLVSKFVVGCDAVAAPLAGRNHLSVIKFLALDGSGAALWTAAYTAVGYLFSNQLDRVALHLARMGVVVTVSLAAALSFYITRKFIRWRRFIQEFRLSRITPEELRAKLNAGVDLLLIDLQDPVNPRAEGIQGAVRINPRALDEYKNVRIPLSREVVLYCACSAESTSARVALALRQRGIERVRPLEGGLPAWRARGFPVTSHLSLALGR